MSNRRQFVRQTAAFGLAAGLLPGFAAASAEQVQARVAEPAGPPWSRGCPFAKYPHVFLPGWGYRVYVKDTPPRPSR